MKHTRMRTNKRAKHKHKWGPYWIVTGDKHYERLCMDCGTFETLKTREVTFKSFREFLRENCWDLHAYKDGLYDRDIYNWFITNPRSRTK